MNILFICSRNQWRSRTAETIFKEGQRHNFRSAGTADNARIRVNEKLIKWADLVFVMEKHHKRRLEEKFEGMINDKKIVILDIADDYEYLDEELVEMLRISVGRFL
jgi:predicted protein tyrosine phosphatase